MSMAAAQASDFTQHHPGPGGNLPRSPALSHASHVTAAVDCRLNLSPPQPAAMPSTDSQLIPSMPAHLTADCPSHLNMPCRAPRGSPPVAHTCSSTEQQSARPELFERALCETGFSACEQPALVPHPRALSIGQEPQRTRAWHFHSRMQSRDLQLHASYQAKPPRGGTRDMLAFCTRQRDTGSISSVALAAEPAQTLNSRWKRLMFRRRQGCSSNAAMHALQACSALLQAPFTQHPSLFYSRPSHGNFDPLPSALPPGTQTLRY